jgi:protein-disulfide isomerase/uncharacterized membrane protein
MKNKKKQIARTQVVIENHTGSARLCLILGFVGLAISLYLLRLHHLLAAKQSTAGLDVCSVLGGSCENALTSAAAVRFGLPLAGWGMLYFVILLSLLLMGRFLKETFAAQAKAAAFLISLPGAAISAFLLFTMLSGRAPFCPFCATIHAINFLLVYLLKRQTGQSFGQILGSVFPQDSDSSDVSPKRAGYVAYFAILLIALAGYEWLVIGEAKPAAPAAEKPQSSELQKIQALLQSEELHQIPVGPDDPVSGDASAPVKLVVFSDYECPACRGYEPELSEIKQSYQGKMQIVFKNFPLDKACNPVVQRDIHIHACEAAFAAESARRQGKFWLYHDELFVADFDNADIFNSLGQSVGLDMSRFQGDRQSDDVHAKVRADIDEGVRLGVNATPTIFLNGRKVLDIRPDVMRFLIERSIAEKKP